MVHSVVCLRHNRYNTNVQPQRVKGQGHSVASVIGSKNVTSQERVEWIGAVGGVVKSLGSKLEVPRLKPGDAKSVGQ